MLELDLDTPYTITSWDKREWYSKERVLFNIAERKQACYVATFELEKILQANDQAPNLQFMRTGKKSYCKGTNTFEYAAITLVQQAKKVLNKK